MSKIIVPDELSYIDQDILPNRCVSLIAGPSNSGKTTLLVQLAMAWLKGEPFLGRHATYGRDLGDFFYVVGDRGETQTRQKLRQLGALGTIKYAILGEKAEPDDFYKCIPDNTRIVAIDAAERLVDGTNINNPDSVIRMLLKARGVAERREMGITMLVGSPKMKKGEEYLHARERIAGAGVWGRFSSTVMSIVMPDPNSQDADTNRSLSIEPKGHTSIKYELALTDRGFEIADPAAANKRLQLIGQLTPAQWYTRQQILELGNKMQLSASSVDRALAMNIKNNILIKGDHGQYQLKA